MIKLKILAALLLIMLVSSCENEPYSSGEGNLSRMTTSFGEASFDTEGRAVNFHTDGDAILNFSRPLGKPDSNLSGTKMRSLLYYNITEDKNLVEPVSLLKVLTANVIDKNEINNYKDDPVKVEAVWISANKKYLNLALSIKTSEPKDENLKHRLGMLFESAEADTVNLRFIHDSDGISANYSVKAYFSVPVRSYTSKADRCNIVRVRANTYDGIKCFELEN